MFAAVRPCVTAGFALVAAGDNAKDDGGDDAGEAAGADGADAE